MANLVKVIMVLIGMSNSIMERICGAHQLESLPGIAIEWGVIGDVGYLADMVKDNKKVVVGGTVQQKICNCPIVCSMVIADKGAYNKKSATIVITVLNILGYKDLKTISLDSSLTELGMDSMMSVKIKQIL